MLPYGHGLGQFPRTEGSTSTKWLKTCPKFLRFESPARENLEKGESRFVDDTDHDEEFSYDEQRKIIHRIDRRLVVITGLMYCVSLMDRGNM